MSDMEARRGKDAAHRGKSEEAPKTDRRPKSFMKNRGKAKKGGAGGKGTWGKPGMDDLYDDDMYLDEGDPNYVEEDPYVLVSRYDADSSKASKVGVPLASAGVHGYTAASTGSPPRTYTAGAGGDAGVAATAPALTLQGFKKAIRPVIAEFFDSGDLEEVSRAVTDLHAPFFHYELVKRAITMAMDKDDRERELASQLISGLYPRVVPMEQVGKAFERLFELVDDLVLDLPDAHKLLSQFLGRAVVDEVLPPSFLSDSHVERLGGDVVREAKVLLSMKHGAARLERIWGPSAGETSDLKRAVRVIMDEFFTANDVLEAARCVHELKVPHYHHEVVKRTLVLAIDKDDAARTNANSVLAYMHEQGVVSEGQMASGFRRVKAELKDISLDNPRAAEHFAAFVAAQREAGTLPADWSGDSEEELAGESAAAGAAAEATS